MAPQSDTILFGTAPYTGYERFLESAQLSDVEVTCNGHKWRLHKITLAAQSDFFRAALCDNFAEATSSTIDLPEDDPIMVARMIRHIYLGGFPDQPLDTLKLQSSTFTCEKAVTESEDEPLAQEKVEKRKAIATIDLAADLFAYGVKFGVRSLQDEACKPVRRVLTMNGWDGPVFEDDDDGEFCQLLQKVYTTTPDVIRELRDVILEGFLNFAKFSVFRESKAVVKCLKETPDLAFHLLLVVRNLAMRKVSQICAILDSSL